MTAHCGRQIIYFVTDLGVIRNSPQATTGLGLSNVFLCVIFKIVVVTEFTEKKKLSVLLKTRSKKIQQQKKT